MDLKNSALEEWMRKYYHSAQFDIGSSGVQDFSLGQLFKLLEIELDELSNIIFNDNDTFGSTSIKLAIAERWGDGNSDTVMVGNGSNEVIFQILTSLIKSNDEIIILHPIYHTLGQLAQTITKNYKFWSLKPEMDWQPGLEELKKIISSNTKFLIVNFPHNPTGISLTNKQLKQLIEICAHFDVTLIWDAAFEDVTFIQQPLTNPYLQYHKTIYIGTLSKSYGLPGLRVGWSISSPEIIQKCKDIKDYTSLYVSPLNDWIATKTIQNIDKVINYLRPKLDKNYIIFAEWLSKHQQYLHGMMPQGGTIAFLRFIDNRDTLPFCNYLARTKHTLVVPGECFGYPQYFRIGFGQQTDILKRGLEHLSDALTNCIVNYYNTGDVLKKKKIALCKSSI
jgi:aspartate/methionine/tyrosine aminotransferase